MTTHSRYSRWLIGIVLALAFAGDAHAQSVARSFRDLQARLRPGALVVVVDATGGDTWGQVAEVSEATLVLLAGRRSSDGSATFSETSKRTFPESAVTEIVRSDFSGARGDAVYFRLANSFDDLRGILKVGQQVTVTDASGKQTKGTVAELSSTRLTLMGQEPLTFAEGQVTLVRRGGRDSLWNGAAIGAAAGFGYIALSLAVQCRGGSCDADYYAGEWFAPAVLFGGGIGAGIGLAIDAAVNRALALYQKTSTTKSLVTVSPIVSRERRGVSLAVRF